MRASEKTFRLARRLRRVMTLPEVLLWQALRGKQADGLRFRRQHPIGPFVLDFYLPSVKLAIEVDGMTHAIGDAPLRDERRDAWLGAQGIRVMRIAAHDVLARDALDGVVRSIVAAARAPSDLAALGHLPRFAGEDQVLLRDSGGGGSP